MLKELSRIWPFRLIFRPKVPPRDVSPTGLLASLMATWLVKEKPHPTVRIKEDDSGSVRHCRWVVATGRGHLVLEARVYMDYARPRGWRYISIDRLTYRGEPLRLTTEHKRDLHEAVAANINMAYDALLANRRRNSDMLALQAISDRLGADGYADAHLMVEG